MNIKANRIEYFTKPFYYRKCKLFNVSNLSIKPKIFLKKTSLTLAILLTAMGAYAQSNEKPNILVIMADDIGWTNVSAYGLGVTGYTTPNLDRIGHNGIIFTEHYAQNSCTAGRASFITGQYPIRSGMTTVGRPGSKLGLQAGSPSLAEVLKTEGYMTGQYGKNHLGDQNFSLPTAHGFDEFFGNLYHQNVSEEPDNNDYPENSEFNTKYGPRGLVHSVASNNFDNTEQPRFGVIGKQKILSETPFTIERMKKVDYEFFGKAKEFMEKTKEENKPFFVWLNPSRQHFQIHLSDEAKYLAKPYTTADDKGGSGLIEHDQMVGELLDYMEQNGMLENTIVVYTTDNGPEHSSMFHGGTTPFRGEKMTTYEGGVRVPTMVMWPGKIKSGQYLRGMQSHMDLFTTLASAAGVDDVNSKMIKEKKQPIDGVDNLDWWLGKTKDSKRNTFLYYYEAEMVAARINQWKMHFKTAEDYYDTYVDHKYPVYYNIHFDPYESYDTKEGQTWAMQTKQWIFTPMQELLGNHLKSLQEYPPLQMAPTNDFSKMIQQAIQKMDNAGH